MFSWLFTVCMMNEKRDFAMRQRVRDRSGKPAARYERGLAANSPTRRGTP